MGMLMDEFIYKIWDTTKKKYVTKNDHPGLNVKGYWKQLQACKEMMFCISHQLSTRRTMSRIVPETRYEIHKFELTLIETIYDDGKDPFKK